jgi:hypothetical protein
LTDGFGAAKVRPMANAAPPIETTTGPTPSGGIEAFWAWWPDGRVRIEAGIDARQIDEALVAEITGKVQGIHPKLTWELGPGAAAPHAFCLSPAGDPELRRLTEKWLRAAPSPDPSGNGGWEFYAAKPGSPAFAEARLEIGEHKVALGDMRFTVTLDPHRELMHVTSFHPAFPSMPEDLRGMTTFVTLDRILGEDGVERWLGGLRTSVTPLEQSGTLPQLVQALGTLAGGATGERFTNLEGRTPGGRPMAATVNMALKRINHLACDTHLTVDVALIDPTFEGMPTDDESEALNDIEDELEEMITGDAVYFGRETTQGRRTLHWYVAANHPVRLQLEAWVGRHPERDVRLTWEPDPRWETAARFR